MCGICGFWSTRPDVVRDADAIARAMSDALSHRGPDADGHHIDRERGLALGHRRLAILDLSPRGKQPMESADGRFVITYNGEVYNFERLREELGGKFRGGSDTEVVLEAISRWGLDAAVSRFVGMFAFALFDRERDELSLVRDRLGIKPLYYGEVAGDVVFASELRPITRVPGFDAEIDRDAVAALLRYNCIPGAQCVYRGVRKVLPGEIVTFREPSSTPEHRTYWDAARIRDSLLHTFTGTPSEAVDLLEETLLTAVSDRMVADVPLGAFLSGGIDSSLVVALMQRRSSSPVRTFSIGFGDDAYNEATHAAEVAAHLGTDHTELYVTSDDALAVIPQLARMYDEPFSDSSQIPTYLVSKLAREHVTVSLSGDGGDELFAGYNRHLWGPRVARTFRVPRPLRAAAGAVLRRASQPPLTAVIDAVGDHLPVRLPTEKLEKLARVLPSRSAADLYIRLRTHWDDGVVLGGGDVPKFEPVRGNFTEQMMFWDLRSYMPDDILTKVDRASMAVSLEARVPLIDHRVVELAWTLPHDMKMRDGQTKWVLRKLLSRYVPPALWDRPKMGFGVPIDQWLRGPLRDWAESLLDERRLREEGILNAPLIRKRWNEHLRGTRDWHHHIWDVLMFQSWCD